jgi:hypothetical protein
VRRFQGAQFRCPHFEVAREAISIVENYCVEGFLRRLAFNWETSEGEDQDA